MPGQPFQNWIYEGERKAIFPSGVIKFYIINAHTLTDDSFSRYKLILFILDNSHRLAYVY